MIYKATKKLLDFKCERIAAGSVYSAIVGHPADAYIVLCSKNFLLCFFSFFRIFHTFDNIEEIRANGTLCITSKNILLTLIIDEIKAKDCTELKQKNVCCFSSSLFIFCLIDHKNWQKDPI